MPTTFLRLLRGKTIRATYRALRSDEDAQLLLCENVVRIFYTLDLRSVELGELLAAQIAETFTAVHPREPLQKLAEFLAKVRPHAHPELRLYENYRRYLRRNPMLSPTC
jgi:hypothetical protein